MPMRRAWGSAASRSPSPQPASNTDASAGMMRPNASFRSRYRKSCAPACGGSSRMRAKKSRHARSISFSGCAGDASILPPGADLGFDPITGPVGI